MEVTSPTSGRSRTSTASRCLPPTRSCRRRPFPQRRRPRRPGARRRQPRRVGPRRRRPRRPHRGPRCRPARRPPSRQPRPAGRHRRRPRRSRSISPLAVDRLVRVLRAAGETPQFGLFDAGRRPGRVPRLGNHVEAVDESQVVVFAGAVLADAFHDRMVGERVLPLHWPHRRQPLGRWTAGGSDMAKLVTVPAVRERKRTGPPLVMVTAYDAPGARIADEAGVDLILVGDSLAMVVLGYEDTLSVTVDDMAHHTAAVARAKPSALVVADLPWLSYHVSVEDTVRNAARLIRAGAQAVKLEGGAKRLPMVRALVDAEIPVMGHIGLTPQSVHAMGGFRVQGKEAGAATELVADAVALADAGCFSIVLEGVPDVVARMVTDAVAIPTIGI